MEKVNYQELQEQVHQICLEEGWEKSWKGGGCYLHLEASELIEALRGKGSNPTEEGGDVLFTLFALLAHYNINIDDCARALIAKIDKKDQWVHKRDERNSRP